MPTQDELLLKLIYSEENKRVMDDANAKLATMTEGEKKLVKQNALWSEQLKKTNAEIEKGTLAAKEHGKAIEDQASGFSKLQAGIVTAQSAIGLFKQGIQIVGEIIDATVGKTMVYAKQVRDLSTNLGLSTEETSKIIQASDDFGISVETVTSALQMMVKRGTAPNIETLAQMADQFVSIKDPVERAAKMTEAFGRNWTALTPMLKEGGAALRASAADAEAMGLVMSETDVKAARELEIRIDQMSDRVQGQLQKIGKAAIKLADDFFFMADAISGESGKKMAATFLINAKNMQAMVKSGKMSAKDYNDGIAGMIDALNRWEVTLGDKARAQLEWNTMVDGFQTPGRNMVRAISDINSKLIDQKAAYYGSADGLRAYAEATQTGGKASQDFAKWIQEGVNQSMSDLKIVMSGAIKNEMTQFNDKQQALMDKAGELRDKISASYGTVKKEAMASLEEVNQSLADNAAAHEEATHRILFGYAEQQLAIGGLTTNEGKALDALAIKWGLKSQEDIDAMANIRKAAEQLAKDDNIDRFTAIVSGDMYTVAKQFDLAKVAGDSLQERIDQLHDKSITIVVDYVQHGKLPGSGAQHGANFIVPQGYPNDTYPLRVSSGEHVVVTNNYNTSSMTNNISTDKYGAAVFADRLRQGRAFEARM